MAVRKTLKSAYQVEEKKPQKWGVTNFDYNAKKWRDHKDRYIQYRLGLGHTRCDMCNKDFPWKSKRNRWGGITRYLDRDVEHKVPISQGGDIYSYDNLQCLCGTCHKSKTSKEIKERQ